MNPTSPKFEFLDPNHPQINEELIAIDTFPQSFTPLRIFSFLNRQDDEALSYQPFIELISEQMEKHRPYFLALVVDEGRSNIHAFDAVNLQKWNRSKETNPTTRLRISQIFLFAITEHNNCFKYVETYGEFKNVNLNILDCNPINPNCLEKKKTFIKVEADHLLTPLVTSVFLDVSDIEPITKTPFLALIKANVKKKAPYILALVLDEGSSTIQYLDAAKLRQKNGQFLKTNPITKKPIHQLLFFILTAEKDRDCFKYLGNSNDSGDKKLLIDTFCNPSANNPEACYKVGMCYHEGKFVEKNLEEAARWLRRAADKKHVAACALLGSYYYHGTGVKQSYEEAARLLIHPANQNDAAAQFLLGRCYAKGKGLNENEKQAVKWLKLSAARGNANAQYYLGCCYDGGEGGLEKNTQEAIRLYTLSANQGNAKAQNNLGSCYDKGEGVEKDLAEAIRLYKLSADQGNAKALFNLGCCYKSGDGVEKDVAEALRFWKLSAEQGDEDAQYNLGVAYYLGDGVGKDVVEAITLWKISARQGNADAQCKLGYYYDEGHYVKRNSAEAAKWWKCAADQGHPDAQNKLAICYDLGEGVEKNLKEALRLWTLSAVQGNAAAQCSLGSCYYAGAGVEKDIANGIHLLTLSAEQGYDTALYSLGCFYFGEKNNPEAIKWWTLAAEKGHEKASELLEKILIHPNSKKT